MTEDAQPGKGKSSTEDAQPGKGMSSTEDAQPGKGKRFAKTIGGTTMIHIYHGDGKGKTTAAMGMSLRTIALGKRVLIVQFLKGSETGEITLLAEYHQVTILRGKPCTKFSFQMNEQEKAECRAENDAMLRRALELHAHDPFSLIILDEVNGALSTKLLSAELLDGLVKQAHAEEDGLELVCTGRNPQPWLVDAADYITEMKCERHPFEQGVVARKGVEY